MDFLFIFIISLVVIIWTIRPLYNFFAKNKYVLLNQESRSKMDGIKAGLPAVVFYTILLALFLYPANTTNLVNSFESGSVILLQLVVIFVLTRYDKRQTKYTVTRKGVQYRKKTINWDQQYEIKYKKTWFIVLHKPRFILRSKDTKIVIPLLSVNINKFMKFLSEHNKKEAPICKEIFKNNKLYYVENRKITKELNNLK